MKIVDVIEYSIFATLTYPGSAFSGASFELLNIACQGVSTAPDQDYFFAPLHGSVSHDDDIKVYYDATFGPGFGDAVAVTFGRSIYMRADQSATTATKPFGRLCVSGEDEDTSP